jgi:hypothetical protein
MREYPELTPEEWLQAVSDMQVLQAINDMQAQSMAIGLMQAPEAARNILAALGLAMQDIMIGDSKNCACSGCVSIRGAMTGFEGIVDGDQG